MHVLVFVDNFFLFSIGRLISSSVYIAGGFSVNLLCIFETIYYQLSTVCF